MIMMCTDIALQLYICRNILFIGSGINNKPQWLSKNFLMEEYYFKELFGTLIDII